MQPADRLWGARDLHRNVQSWLRGQRQQVHTGVVDMASAHTAWHTFAMAMLWLNCFPSTYSLLVFQAVGRASLRSIAPGQAPTPRG